MIGDSSCSGKVQYEKSFNMFKAICIKKDRFNKPIKSAKRLFSEKKEAIEFVRRFVNSNGDLT